MKQSSKLLLLQAIHSRSMLPCQDSPGVKVPYTAAVSAVFISVTQSRTFCLLVYSGSRYFNYTFHVEVKLENFMFISSYGDVPLILNLTVVGVNSQFLWTFLLIVIWRGFHISKYTCCSSKWLVMWLLMLVNVTNSCFFCHFHVSVSWWCPKGLQENVWSLLDQYVYKLWASPRSSRTARSTSWLDAVQGDLNQTFVLLGHLILRVLEVLI